MKKEISWSDFEKIDIRVGTIIDAKTFDKARNPAYILQVDFGSELGIKKTSAQITEQYQPSDLLSKQVLAVVNFPPKQIADIMSDCLVLGVYTESGVVLLATDKTVKNGGVVG
jgi:tRNA-binding protein